MTPVEPRVFVVIVGKPLVYAAEPPDMLAADLAVVQAQVPRAEVANYQNQLQSVTGGQGSYTMELSHYEAVPANVHQQIVAQYKPKADED